jgi:hypothetical protein
MCPTSSLVAENFFCSFSFCFRFSLHTLKNCCCTLGIQLCVMCISNLTVASRTCVERKGIHIEPTCSIMLQGPRTCRSFSKRNTSIRPRCSGRVYLLHAACFFCVLRMCEPPGWSCVVGCCMYCLFLCFSRHAILCILSVIE